ncbi:MAG: LuxR family transcriptional regulator [Caulobacterales bacterium]|jgi:LuxR family quorum-sensing system transcriptional regulator CciR
MGPCRPGRSCVISRVEVVQTFTDKVQTVQRHSDLRALAIDTARELGLDYIALLHHVDLNLAAPEAVRVSNYPEAFIAAQRANRHFVDDPVFSLAQRSARGFCWTDLAQQIQFSPSQSEVLRQGARAGLGEGYTVPLHVPGEFAASASFVVRAGKTRNPAALPWLHHVASFAFESGRQIALTKTMRSRRTYKLSGRQLDCLVLVARGATAREAAARLGLKPDTVEKHLSAAKARVGVRATPHLLAHCLFDGKITFQDIMCDKNA